MHSSSKPLLDLFPHHNPIFLETLRKPWTTSSRTDLQKLEFSNEANQKLDSINNLLQQLSMAHYPQLAEPLTLSKISSLTFREDLELYAMLKLERIETLLPVYSEAIRVLQAFFDGLYQDNKVSKAKVHAQIKENADFEIIIFADSNDDLRMKGPYEIINRLYKEVLRIENSERLRFEVEMIEEENEERAYIELRVEDSKIIIRDFSSEYHANHRNPFGIEQGECSFRSQFLTNRLLFLMESESLLPQTSEDFSQDLYPFMVREFLRLEKPELLLPSSLGTLNQIDQEYCLWNELLDFYQDSQNLYQVLYSAQERLLGFGDYDCVIRNADESYSINFLSSYGFACQRLVEALRPVPLVENQNLPLEFCPEFFLSYHY